MLADTHTSGLGYGCNAGGVWLTDTKPNVHPPGGQVDRAVVRRSPSLVDTLNRLAKLNSAAATAAPPTTEEEVER